MTDTDSEGRAWDWLEDADDVIVREQSAVAIYPGPDGVVIRRRGDLWNGGGDDVICFTIEQAPAVATAILEAAGLDATALTPERTGGSVNTDDKTAAKRQRRYCERKKKELTPDIFDRADRDDRNAVTRADRDVTDRDAVTREAACQ